MNGLNMQIWQFYDGNLKIEAPAEWNGLDVRIEQIPLKFDFKPFQLDVDGICPIINLKIFGISKPVAVGSTSTIKNGKFDVKIKIIINWDFLESEIKRANGSDAQFNQQLSFKFFYYDGGWKPLNNKNDPVAYADYKPTDSDLVIEIVKWPVDDPMIGGG